MFIKEIIMDGFKCYSNIVSLKNIDRSFTAITGMNGSGKSNIIDAIIFALDLNTSKYMRVSNLKELININRKDCTVTIIFDNSDKKQSPAGYESFDQIEISRNLDHEGKSKFKLNGHNSTKNSIESLCKSIGITNNFVIMQGHITKIINMKSVDLRKMIEETAGTRSYSEEREKSLEVLEKKEFKLREAREHLRKTITPFFEQLKKEKKIFEENRDFEANRKAYLGELNELEDALSKFIYNEKAIELSKICEKYLSDIEDLNEIEEKVREAFSVQDNSKIDFDNQLNNYKNRLQELKSINYDEILNEKIKQRDEKQQILNNLSNTADITSLKERESILSKELLSGSNLDKLNDLENSRNLLNKKNLEFNDLIQEINVYFKQVLLKNTSNSNDCDRNLCSFLDSEFSQINSCRTINNDKNLQKLKNIYSDFAKNNDKLSEIDEKITNIKSKIIYPMIDGVYGTVDENFDLIDEKYKEAIFTILGSRAKFIICRDEEIASKVLISSDRKVSCIPLNKISYSEPSSVPYKCINALKAISFDPKFSKAFKHIFSNFYLFEDNETASKCCYDCKVMCVTYDGTVYDPSGTLTCGKSTFKPNIIKSSELKILEQERLKIKEDMPSQEMFFRFSEFLKKLQRKEAIENEIERISSKNELLQNLCSANVNVTKELENIRSQILEAANHDKIKNSTLKDFKKLEDEISEFLNKKEQSLPQIQEIEKKISDLQKLQIEDQEKQLKRKNSVKMFEIYDEKRKNLIKSTVQLELRIKKLYDEIKSMNIFNKKHSDKNESCQINTDQMENKQNFSNITKKHTEFDSFLSEKFDISSDVFKIFPIQPNFDKNQIESQIQILKEKINQKRITVSMDPSNFELLEKNILQVQSLEEKISRLEKDRQEILKNIEKLNEIGITENMKAFNHINKQIRQFLQYFLPNTDILISQDFEIKVKIGNWKNSLSELSGGQKSLIALCLMFSMLTFRPAPFYIFDEIDAALDLNYTQAIGQIIKNEFKGAQFIVISLKNNMFDYANRIFRVYIQDHKSKIALLK